MINFYFINLFILIASFKKITDNYRIACVEDLDVNILYPFYQ